MGLWWDSWYGTATGAVSASMTAARDAVSSLFKEPSIGSGAYEPDDPPLSDVLRSRQSGTPYDLFSVESGPLAASTDIQQSILTRPKTWDEMSWWEKARTYVGIVPGAVADTVGMGRPAAATPASTVAAAGESVAAGAESVGKAVGGVVSGTVSSALGLGQGGVGGFLGSTLWKIILGLVVIVVGLFFVMRIAKRVTPG